MFKFTCSECGSDDVSSKCWANPNTDEIDDYVGSESGDNWCNKCEEHVTLNSEEIPNTLCPVCENEKQYTMFDTDGTNLVEHLVCKTKDCPEFEVIQ